MFTFLANRVKFMLKKFYLYFYLPRNHIMEFLLNCAWGLCLVLERHNITLLPRLLVFFFIESAQSRRAASQQDFSLCHSSFRLLPSETTTTTVRKIPVKSLQNIKIIKVVI